MADSPKEAEAAQALFCALADDLGTSETKKQFNLKIYPTYELFKSAFNEKIVKTYTDAVKTPTISLEQIEKFLINNVSWYNSSINIARVLIEEIDSLVGNKFNRIQKPKLQDFDYVRGAAKQKGQQANAMENISFLFNIANKNENNYFGDINKWSPADIYFVSKRGEKEIIQRVNLLQNSKIKNSYDLGDLNSFISSLLEDGDLLPLSLKKAEREAHIVPVNFNRDVEQEYISKLKYYGVSDWSKLYTIKKPITRDIKIYFSSSKRDKLKIRHDPYSANYGVNKAVKCEIEVTGAGGRGGSVVGIPLISQILGEVDSELATKLKFEFNLGIKVYEKEIIKLNKKYGIKPGRPKQLQSPAKEMYDDERSQLSALYISNAIMPIIYNWFSSNEKNAKLNILNDKAVQSFVEYTSSRTKKSGKFVIAK